MTTGIAAAALQQFMRQTWTRDSLQLFEPQYVDAAGNFVDKEVAYQSWEELRMDEELMMTDDTRTGTAGQAEFQAMMLEDGSGRKGKGGFTRATRKVKGTGFLKPPVFHRSLSQLTLRGFDSFVQAKGIVTASGSWTGCELDPLGANCLFAPEQGTKDNERLGQKAWVKSIHVTGSVERETLWAAEAAFASYGAPTVFLALVRNKQTNGVQLNSEDVYTGVGTGNNNCANPLRNLFFEDKFDILKTERFDMPMQAVAVLDVPNQVAIGADRYYFDWYIRLDDEVVFLANGDDVSDLSTVSYHIVGCRSPAPSATNVPACCLHYVSRVRYTC